MFWGDLPGGELGRRGGSEHYSQGQELREQGCGVPSCLRPILLWLPRPPSPLFIPSAGPGGLHSPSEVAIKSVTLPVLALWVGCCPGGVLAKQGPSLREPTATPTPVGTLTLQSSPSWPGPPNGE